MSSFIIVKLELEKCTIDLVKLSREIVELSREMEKCYQSKSD